MNTLELNDTCIVVRKCQEYILKLSSDASFQSHDLITVRMHKLCHELFYGGTIFFLSNYRQ